MSRIPPNDDGSGATDIATRTRHFVSVCTEQLREAIDESRAEMDGLTAAIMSAGAEAPADLLTRLQSVDRLMQRLTNVYENLARMANFLGDAESRDRGESWAVMLEEARNSFTMEQERELFDAMLNGMGKPARRCGDNVMLFDE